MKKNAIPVIIFLTFIFGAYAQDTSVNVNTITAPKLTSLPKIDGDLSDAAWANIAWIPVDQSGDSPAATDPGDLDIKMKVGWDDTTNAIYLAINVIDNVFVDLCGLGSSMNEGGWNNERLEIVIDGTNSGDPNSSTTTGLHQQYTFDFPNNWDLKDPANQLFGNFDQAKLPVSTTFIPMPVYERIEGTANLDKNSYDPTITDEYKIFNIADDYLQSAVQIRVTDPTAKEWLLAPVEFNWEIKLVVFEYLQSSGTLGLDLTDVNNVKNGWIDVFKDAGNTVKKLKEKDVIGFTPQMNDADELPADYDPTLPSTTVPTRIHQTNTTGVSGNWNSSETLTGLILGPAPAAVADWYLH